MSARSARARQPQNKRPFPRKVGSCNVVDYTLVHCSDLTLMRQPFVLERPPASGYFDSVAQFSELTCAATVEMFREENAYSSQMCGSKVPRDQHLHVRIDRPEIVEEIEPAPGCTELGMLTIGPHANMEKYPLENKRAIYTNFVCLIQIQKHRNDDRVEPVGSGMLVGMAKKHKGCVFKAPYEVLEKIESAVTNSHACFVRKLTNLNFMTTGPVGALQRIATEKPSLPGDSLAALGFIVPEEEVNARLEHFPKSSELDSWLGRHATATALLDLEKFNRMQRRALALFGATKRGLVLIQGPPGTGKSHLIANGLIPAAIQEGSTGVLVVCNSNCAVDSICEKAIASTCTIRDEVVRVGTKNRTALAIVQGGFYVDSLDIALKGPKKVMFTTLYTASQQAGADFCERFDTLILDEAAQVEDMKVFVLLCNLMKNLKKVVCVGDHKQLQPYVSEGVRSQGFGVSTMERLIEHYRQYSENKSNENNRRTIHVMLEEQHRMPSGVKEIVSKLYYAGNLKDGPNIKPSRGLRLVDGTQMPPVLAFDLKFGASEFNPYQRSCENFEEAEASGLIYDFVLSHMRKFDEERGLEDLGLSDICVLSPFNRHKNRLRTFIAGIEENEWNKYDNIGLLDGPSGNVDPQLLKIKNIDTVDKFQGSEREVVMINTVVERCNGDRAGDPHFINVAMSRCTSMLVLVGHLSSISETDAGWRAIMDHTSASPSNGTVLSCNKIDDVKNGLIGLIAGGFSDGPDAKRMRAR